MRLVELTLHDDRKVLVNPDRVAYVVPVGGNASIALTRIVMVNTAEPVDVRETQAAVDRLLVGYKEGSP
jgi:hypothetical protein